MLSPVQFLDKVADSPVASMTGALGRQYRNCGLAVAVLTLGSMSLLCRASLEFLGAFCEVRSVGGRGSSHRW